MARVRHFAFLCIEGTTKARGTSKEALKCYQQAAAKAPQDAAAYRLAGHALTRLGRNDEAGRAREMSKSIEKNLQK